MNSKKVAFYSLIGPYLGEFYYDVMYFNPAARYFISNITNVIPWYVGFKEHFFLYRDFIPEKNVYFINKKYINSKYKTRNRKIRRSGFKAFVDSLIPDIRKKIKRQNLNFRILPPFTYEDVFNQDDSVLDTSTLLYNKIQSNEKIKFLENLNLDILFYVPNASFLSSPYVTEDNLKQLFYLFTKKYENKLIGFLNFNTSIFILNKKVENFDLKQFVNILRYISKTDITLSLLYSAKNIVTIASEWNCILNLAEKNYISFGTSKWFNTFLINNDNNVIISNKISNFDLSDIILKKLKNF